MPAVAIVLKNGHAKNATPYNNQQNTSDNDKKEWACRKIYDSILQSTSTPRVYLVAERNRGGKKPFRIVADGGADRNGMAVPTMPGVDPVAGIRGRLTRRVPGVR